MIQLVFDAPDARAALGVDPVEVGYSSHEGAERAAWDDDEARARRRVRPVVYPAAGSHANKYSDALWLGQLGGGRGRLRRHARRRTASCPRGS